MGRRCGCSGDRTSVNFADSRPNFYGCAFGDSNPEHAIDCGCNDVACLISLKLEQGLARLHSGAIGLQPAGKNPFRNRLAHSRNTNRNGGHRSPCLFEKEEAGFFGETGGHEKSVLCE